MPRLTYYVGAEKRKAFNFHPLASASEARTRGRAYRVAGGARRTRGVRGARGPASPVAESDDFHENVVKLGVHRSAILRDQDESTLLISTPSDSVAAIATESLIIDNPKLSDLKWLADAYGMELVNDHRGIILMRSSEGGTEGVKQAFEAARAAVAERGLAAQPNFIRASAALLAGDPATHSWHLDNRGTPGVVGADLHAVAAWTITQGHDGIIVAVIDEGVATSHPWLKKAVVAEADFHDFDNTNTIGPSAKPHQNDNHGTACAGVVLSRHDDYRGVAPKVSLAAVRIAERAGGSNWQGTSDFEAAQGIDWAFSVAGAHVLSCSWDMGGLPAPVIETRIRGVTQKGRKGLGAVVVFAAGNSQGAINSPAQLDCVLTVGASNQWDERKTIDSQDGQDDWGSCHGDELDVVAPGVAIRTTDINGPHGESSKLSFDSFRGTSAAAPMAAAVAALVLSIKPKLTEAQVRDIIKNSADPIGAGATPNRFVGAGRLNAYAALRLAKQA
jgi:subtilisin family serine protease